MAQRGPDVLGFLGDIGPPPDHAVRGHRMADAAYLDPDQVLAIARAGARRGCHEALFTLGERPELQAP